jgi:hypothetical protein
VIAALRQPDAGVGSLYGELRRLLPGLVSELGLDPSGLTERTDRQWHPMDGSEPPDCPFADYTVHEVAAGEVRVTLRLDSAWWNEAEQARSDLSLSVRGAGTADFVVSAWSAASGAPDVVEGVKVEGAVPDAVERVLPGLR